MARGSEAGIGAARFDTILRGLMRRDVAKRRRFAKRGTVVADYVSGAARASCRLQRGEKDLVGDPVHLQSAPILFLVWRRNWTAQGLSPQPSRHL